MRSISSICTHAQRIYGTGKSILHQYVVKMIKITMDTDNILTDESTPYQQHNDHTFATHRPISVQHHYANASEVGAANRPHTKKKRNLLMNIHFIYLSNQMNLFKWHVFK